MRWKSLSAAMVKTPQVSILSLRLGSHSFRWRLMIVGVEAIMPGARVNRQVSHLLSQQTESLYKQYRSQEMAPRAGLEPATQRLTAACSTD